MIKDNILSIQERISRVCAHVFRNQDEIAIVAVSKGRTTEEIEDAIEEGITDIGENRLQEALPKYNQLRTPNSELPTIKWHMIGHLQTNKVKEAVKIFDLIQSVDSMRLAQEINQEAAKINKSQDILLEIKTSPEETKFGFKPQEVMEVIKQMSALKNLNIKGLMTIAPLVTDKEEARTYFRTLKNLRDELNKLYTVNCTLSTLSMGMTDDFEVAIEEGSNMLRLGRAIFEG